MRCAITIIGAALLATSAGCRSTPSPAAAVSRTDVPPPTEPVRSAVQLVAHQDDADGEPTVSSTDKDLEDAEQVLPESSSNLPLQNALSLSEFEALAVQANPAIQLANAQVTAAQGQHLQAGLYPNPMIGYHAVNIGNRGTAGRQAGFIQQRFVTGGKLKLNQLVAWRETRNRRELLRAARQRVLTDVRSRFYAALVAQRRLELTNELLIAVNEVTTSTAKLLDAEQASENTLLQAEIEVEQAQILKDNATNAMEEAWRQLAVVVGRPALPLGQLAGDLESSFEERDQDLLAAQLIASHPLVTAARARVDKANVAITRAEREVIPDINFLADAARTNHTGYDTAQARVSVEVPLWDRNEGNILTAQAELAAARANLKRIELRLQQQLAVAFRQYSNALHQANRYRERILPRAERSLDLVRDGYDNGQVEYLTLLNAQQKFVQVNLAYTDSLRDLQQTAALLDGKLLGGSLKSGTQ